jgi:hypothetical protein
LNAVSVLSPQLPYLVAWGSVLPIFFAFDAICVSFEMKRGLKKSSFVTNGKLLTTKSQSSIKMSGVSTMTKFRTEQALVASLTGAG